MSSIVCAGRRPSGSTSKGLLLQEAGIIREHGYTRMLLHDNLE